jgi:putative ABC transport system permease protein
MVAMLGALALFSLLMCAVLTINLIDALMASEQRSIGMMRAIGGRPLQIARDYLLGIALLGLAASLLSLPLALPRARNIAGFVAAMVNFDLISGQWSGSG